MSDFVDIIVSESVLQFVGLIEIPNRCAVCLEWSFNSDFYRTSILRIGTCTLAHNLQTHIMSHLFMQMWCPPKQNLAYK